VRAEQLVQPRAVLGYVRRERARELEVGKLVARADVGRRGLVAFVHVRLRVAVRVVQHRRQLEQLAHGKAVARVQVFEVELDARLYEELLRHRLEEDDAVLLCPDLVQDLHVLVVPLAQPDEDVGD